MLVLIRGAGDLASGIALRLHHAHYQIVMTDLPKPTAIRRTVCFSQALLFGTATVEDVTARRAENAKEALAIVANSRNPDSGAPVSTRIDTTSCGASPKVITSPDSVTSRPESPMVTEFSNQCFPARIRL